MEQRKLPLWMIGALVGGLLTVSLTALSFLGSQVLGLPFAPFEFFDWLSRVLSGDIIRFTITNIVNFIRTFNLGPTDTTAKLIEQIMGIGTFVILGIVLGAAFFAAASKLNAKKSYLSGLVLGAAVGIAMLLVISVVNRPTQVDPLVSGVWVMALFIIWGAALNWVYADMTKTGKLVKSDGTVLEVDGMDRRQFLVRLGGATATITVIGAGLGSMFGQRPATSQLAASSSDEASTVGLENNVRWSATNDLPNIDAALQPAPGTRPEFTSIEDHYRIDINAVPPVVDGETWTLPITGLAQNPLNLTMADLQAYEPVHRFLTMACISNPVGGDLISTQRWTGASLKQIMEDAQPDPSVTHLKITGADGFYEYIALEHVMEDERITLNYYWDGVPLTIEHGFPLRIFIPDRYGMKQPKWITGIELLDHEEEGFWVARGWDQVAQVQTTSVVDPTSATDSFEENGVTYVPIGGIAWAGARGISQVQVRIDGGEWVEAQLRDPISDTTWVIWRYDWEFTEGAHSFEVRAVDGRNDPQIETRRGVQPSGATGIHSRDITF
jgi:DMSO/TMAO reductase YedYZ molybdopterin-dependent catalytic subunit